jgi:hypothetical protein
MHNFGESELAAAMIDRLKERGLIERGSHPTDRRTVVISLSKAATQELPAIFASLAEAMARVVSGYPIKDLEVLADFFAEADVLWKKEREKSTRCMARAGSRRRGGCDGCEESAARRPTTRERV